MPERYIFVDSYEHGRSVVPASPIFAHEGDILISSQYEKIDRDYINYLSELRSVDGHPVFPSLRKITLLEPKGIGDTTARKALQDPNLLGQLRQHTKNCGVGGIKCFAVASEMHPEDDSLARLAKAIEVPLLSGNYEFFAKLGDKSNGRRLFKELGLEVPDGVENVSKVHVEKALENPQVLPNEGVWIKANWGAFGIRNIYVAPIAIEIAKQDFAKLSSKYNGNYLVEKHIQNAVSFPGVLIQINNDCLCIQDIHEQSGVMISNYYNPDKEDKNYFEKNPFFGPPYWWGDLNLRKRFENEARKIGLKLFETGWQGRVCIDAIIDDKSNIYWDEINLRDGGSALVVEALRRLYRLTEEVCLEDVGVRFNVRHLKTRGIPFKSLLNKLDKELGIGKKEENMVVLNADFYSERGFDMVSFGKNVQKEILVSLLDKAEEKVRKYVV